MKKIVMMIALAAILGLSATADDQVYSKNAVGFISPTVESGKSYLMCANFESMNGDSSVTSILDAATCGLPSGTKLYLWDPVGQEYTGLEKLESRGGWHWEPGVAELNLGQTFWMLLPERTPSEEFVVYFLGQVPSQDEVVSLVPGVNFGAYSFPVETSVTNLNLNGVLPGGSKIYYYDNDLEPDPGWAAEIWDARAQAWTPGTHVFQPAEGMIISTTTITNWNQPKPYTWP